MEIVFRHAITYTTRGDVPVPVVAKCLLANDRLIREGLRVLDAASPNVALSNVRVKVADLSNASPLKAAFAVAVVAAFQDELSQDVPKLVQQLSGVELPESAHTIVTVLVMMVALYVISGASERIFGTKKLEKVRKEFEAKKERLSELSGVPAEAIERYLAATIPEGRQTSLLGRAIDFLLPAKLEPGVEVLSAQGTRLSAEVIAEVPMDMATADAPVTMYELHGVVVDIHRADRDQNKYGWRAVIETVSDRKVRMELVPTIDPAQLYGKTAVVGDVTVIEERQETGEYLPKTYHLTAVRGQPSEV